MSELTPCNWHTLQRMKRKAAERGIEVIVTRNDPERWGWTTARYEDQDEPSASFMELSDGCVC